MLRFHHAYGHIDGTVPKLTDPAGQEKWDLRDLLAQVLIKNNMSDKQMVHVNQDSITTAAKHTFYLCEPLIM
jgi:hypothetical protein